MSDTNLLTRDDTLLGVCQALGDDFGFNPVYIRVALAASLLWNPVAIVGGYLAAGLLVALSRFAFPDRAAAAGPAETAAVSPDYEGEEAPLAEAA